MITMVCLDVSLTFSMGLVRCKFGGLSFLGTKWMPFSANKSVVPQE